MSVTAKTKCKRCGKCCNPVHLSASPAELKLGYKNWNNSKRGSWFPNEVYLLYPMLRFVRYDKKMDMYLYRCVHFELQDEKSGCGIQDIKPKMCSEYPYYDKPQEVRIGQNWYKPEGVPKGCGYIVSESA